MKVINKITKPLLQNNELESNYYYLVDPDTGEIVDYIDKQSYNNHNKIKTILHLTTENWE